MPKLTRTVEDLEKVDAKYRDLYTKNDETGHYELDVEGIEDPTALKSALRKERENGKMAKRIKALFPDIEDDELEDAVKAAVEAQKKATAKGGKGKDAKDKELDDDTIERLVEKRVNEKLAEYEPKLKAGETSAAELRKERIENAARRALAAAGVMPERQDAALKLMLEPLDLGEDSKTVVVKDKDGDPRSITIDKFASTEFKKDHPYFFQGSGASGSGANASTKTTPGDTSKMSPNQKIEAGLAKTSA